MAGMYKTTQLWNRAREQAETANGIETWEKLEAEFDKFWTKGVRIAEKISSELPGLTLHNEAHLGAVWDVADLIAGPRFPMTPLEVFVFGGSVLLHDLGHSITAYKGGIASVKRTPEWREAVLHRLKLDEDDCDPSNEAIESPDIEIERAALFDTMRALHAQEAERLLANRFKLNNDLIYLIEDTELRRHLGPLIGQIAASHHWDRETLLPRLRPKVGALASAPRLGEIQPVKLACLLRSADACQIDQRRAPDFDMALQAPIGMSKLHWEAQNRLQVPFIEDGSLTFTSSIDFTEDMASSWWVAHDLIQVAHRELQECDALMRDQGLPPLRVKAITGASAPASLARHVRPIGWAPVDASIRVSDPRCMVEMFGGAQYYGEDAYWVPLRELLQNGIDAIEARRLLEPEGSSYEGRILVEQVADRVDGEKGYWLHVYDDGVGMSERVLTRALVDFGHSAKSKGELADEFTGLRGKRMHNIGRYGIGFFSVLMLSDYIVVQSKPYDQGLDTVKRLRFAWGSERRPLLITGEATELKGMSTRVSLFMTMNCADRLLSSLVCGVRKNHSDCGDSMTRLVKMIAPLPNCRVDVCQPKGACNTVRSPAMYYQEEASEWLKSLNVQAKQEFLERVARTLTPLRDRYGKVAGLASINFRNNESGLFVEKGLCGQQQGQSGRLTSRHIIGVLPSSLKGPQRNVALLRRGEAFENWRTAQLNNIQLKDYTFQERDCLSRNIYMLGGDPLKFATVGLMPFTPLRKAVSWYSIGDLIDRVANKFSSNPNFPLMKAESHWYLWERTWRRLENDPCLLIVNEKSDMAQLWNNKSTLAPNIISNIGRRTTEEPPNSYGNPDPSDEICLLGCIHRSCEERGLSLAIDRMPKEFIGVKEDHKTGVRSPVVSKDVLLLRIRPAA